MSEVVETVEAAGPLVLEWLDSESEPLEWGETTLVRTTGNIYTLGVDVTGNTDPIVESARLRNAPAGADVEWTLEYDLVGVPGASIASLVSRSASVPNEGMGSIVSVIVPQHVTQLTADPGAQFITQTAVTLVTLSATYNGVSYGPIYLIITGQSYYSS